MGLVTSPWMDSTRKPSTLTHRKRLAQSCFIQPLDSAWRNTHYKSPLLMGLVAKIAAQWITLCKLASCIVIYAAISTPLQCKQDLVHCPS